MHDRRTIVTCFSAAALVGAFLAGCGGGTSALTGQTSPTLANQSLDGTGGVGGHVAGAPVGVTAPDGTTGRAGLFVTGSLPAGYSHAWVTIQKIEVVDGSEKATTIWESRAGLSVDLATLHDTQGPLYALITSAAVPAGQPQKRLRVTLGSALLGYAPGATVAATLPLSDSIARDADGRPVISFALARPRDLGTGKADIVIDFDGTKSVIAGGHAQLALADASKAARAALLADTSRQVPGFFTGTVADVAAPSTLPSPDATLMLHKGPGATNDLAPSPAPFRTPAPNRKSKAAPMDSAPTFTLQDAGGSSVVIEPGNVLPVYPAVSTSPSPAPSVVAAGSPAPAVSPSVAALAATRLPASGERVWVRGVLSEETKRIIPSEIVVLPTEAAAVDDSGTTTPASADTTADAVGSPASVSANSGTFSLAARQVSGIVPVQSAITVVVGKQTDLRDAAGGALAQSDLYGALQRPDAAVEAAGVFDPVTGTLTASRVALEPAPAKPAAAGTTH